MFPSRIPEFCQANERCFLATGHTFSCLGNVCPLCRNDPEGELLQGRRRGRSVRDASPPGELPPFKRVRRADGPSSTAPSSEPSRAGSPGVTPELTPEAEDLQEPESGANHHLEDRPKDGNGVEVREPLEEAPLDAIDRSAAEVPLEVGEFNHQSWQGGSGCINGNHQQVHDNPDSHAQGKTSCTRRCLIVLAAFWGFPAGYFFLNAVHPAHFLDHSLLASHAHQSNPLVTLK